MRKLTILSPSDSSSSDITLDEEDNCITQDPKSQCPNNLIEALSSIAKIARRSRLSDSFLSKIEPQIQYVQAILPFDNVAIVFLACLLEHCFDRETSLSHLAKYLDCDSLTLLTHLDSIDSLVKSHYLITSDWKQTVNGSFTVKNDVIKAIRENRPYVYDLGTIDSTRSFLKLFDKLIKTCHEDQMEWDELRKVTFEAYQLLPESSIFKCKLEKYDLEEEEFISFLYCVTRCVMHQDDHIRLDELDIVLDEVQEQDLVKEDLRRGESELIKEELVEYTYDDGFFAPESIKVSEKAKEEMLTEVWHKMASRNEMSLKKSSDFAAKEMYYNEAEGQQVAQLTSLLQKANFNNVQQRMTQKGMRKGFCCLFYGTPGTGKTETVYQLARQTGRDIMIVEVSDFKNCFVGESEKRLKKLFIKYQNLVNECDQTPILLFNEADAVLGVRMENASRGVDKMENSLQNIILQEMENLEGIMIATTNLTTNLDKAFERRFIYKINFSRPQASVRAKLWKAMMPELSEAEAISLAQDYDMSGGEIENVVRLNTVSQILSDKNSYNLHDLQIQCAAQHISSISTRKMGF